ncbi:MAG: hypothetical protein J3K34DRAFT_437933, partial [Monoraphidium minutum]
ARAAAAPPRAARHARKWQAGRGPRAFAAAASKKARPLGPRAGRAGLWVAGRTGAAKGDEMLVAPRAEMSTPRHCGCVFACSHRWRGAEVRRGGGGKSPGAAGGWRSGQEVAARRGLDDVAIVPSRAGARHPRRAGRLYNAPALACLRSLIRRPGPHSARGHS